MTLDELRLMRPAQEPRRVTIRPTPKDDPVSDEQHAENIGEYVRAFLDKVDNHFGSAAQALEWLRRTEGVTNEYRVARLFCPNGKKLGELYCLPKGSPPVVNAGGHRILVVPTSRGRLAAVGGDEGNDRDPGEAWWYLSDDDVWDLRCRCCPRPDGGVRAGDFLGEHPARGFTVVLL
jgi:hypothetical protein